MTALSLQPSLQAGVVGFTQVQSYTGKHEGGVLQYGIESGAHELEVVESNLVPDQGSRCRLVKVDVTCLRKQLSKDLDPGLSGQPI